MSYSDLIDHVDNLGRIQDQSNELAGAMLRSHGTNYDRYANLKKLELKTGTPAPWMIDDPELAAETQRRSDLDGSKWQLLSSHAPITSQFASENDHASLMGDDLDNTSLLEKAFGVVSNSARSLSAVPWSMSQGLWAVPRVAGDIAQTWTKPISEFTGLPDTGGAVADYARSQQKGAELTANKIRGDRSNMGLVERGAYSGIESFGQNLVMLPLTIASGGSTVPMLTGMSVVAGGQAYGKARDKNISPLGSLLYGTSQGAIEYATEMIPALRFVNDLKLKSSMGTMARNLFGAEVPGEQIATLTGDLNEWAILNPDKPFADYLRERPSAAAETLIATIVGTGSMVMTAKAAEKTGYSVEKYQQAQLNKNFMLALGESATDSKLLKRLPEKFQELVGRLKEGGDIENVYIPGEQWKTYWQEKGTDPAQMADDLVDGGSAQYVEALAAGGDIVIPLEVYATQLAATEHHAALIEHSRLRAGDATSYEAAQFEADFEQTVKELQDSAGKESADRPSYFKVYDDIYGQLQGIGYDRKTAEQYATIAAVRAKQRAAVLGKDAFELYNESPIKIVRPLPEGVQRQSVDLGIDPLLDRLRNNDVPTDESVFGESLLQFVRKRGVRDDRGDLKSMDVDAELKRKAFQSKDDFEQSKILRKNGMELDRVREGAVEAGFLPEGSTTADLLDKIDQELRGTPVYSNQVANPKEFDTKLALDELKMHLDQVGIDYNQLSNEQIRRELYQMQGGEDTFYQAMVPDSVPVTPESIAEAKRQYDDVVNRYKGTPLWMKAPNGEPTKLTEQQWVQVRTPFFKEWFGDWEAAVTIFQGEQFVKEAIHNKGTGIFKINGIEADPNGDVSKALGSPVTAHELNANDLRHMLRQHGSTKVESAKNQIAVEESDIQLIPYILKNYDNVKQGSSDSTGRKSVIFSKRINGTIYYVEAETVKAGVISSKTMYIKPSLGVNAAQGNLNNTSLTAQSRGHKDSVTKLIGGIKSNVSKVVDANGEPLVVYHQTTAENKDSIYGAGFDLSKVGARGSDEGVPDGIFMKPTDADAGFRGKVQMPLFTNLKNPFLVRDRESLDSFLRMSEQYFKWSQETVFTDKEKAREFDKIEKGSNDLDAMDAFIEQWKQLNESNAAQSREAATEFLRNEGFDGVVLDRDKGSFGREVKTIIAFDPNQVKSSVDNVGTFSKDTGNILYQGEAKKRGFFRSSPDMTAREIGILKDADLSTFIHESSHSWLEELKADAARADAPGQLKNDWATVAKWLGNTDGEITREQHEQFARGGEAYFMEGKAPSAELQPIMQRFKSWLTSIYKTLTGLNVKMNDDVRGVFDRLLASEAEITQARQAQNMVELFATAEDAGMTTAEFAAYRKQAAQAHADEVEKLDRKLMQEKAREQAQWWKDARAAMRTEVEAEAHAAPVYRAIRLLSSGKMFDGTEGPVMKLDRAVLVKMYGEPFLKRLPRGFGYIYANEGGMHPDAVASLFGYDSGDAMIKEMIEAPAVNKWIDGETDMRMREQYGDMLLDGTVADEALAAIHGDRRADVMAAELRAIKRQQKIVKPALDAQKKDDQQNRQVMNASVPSRETFQMAAAQIIGAKKIGDISPRLYLEAERRAGKKAFDAVAKKDWQTAAEAKQQQLLNHYLYREASKAQEQIDDIMKEYDKLKRPDEKLAKSRDINLVNAARAILNRFGIDKNGLDAAEHLKQVEIYTPDLYQDLSAAIEAATQSPKPYKQLTMDEFLAVNDAVMNLWELSRRSKQIEIDGKIVNRDEVIDELNARMEELGLPANQVGMTKAVSKWEKFSAALVGVRAATTRVEAWVDAMDGGKADGVFRRYIWNPVIDGVDKYRTAKQNYISKYLDLLKPIEKDISNEKIAAPELGALGYTFNGKQELLGALLHTGNESNMEKLLVGRQWGFIAEDGGLDTTAWDVFTNRMMDEGKLTKADFDFIQGVWDLLEEAKPLAQKAHKEMYGYYFSEITANEFTNRYGSYRGGYAPAIVDSNINQDQASRQEKESLESTNNSFMFPSTGRGFTKSRVTYNKPLILDLRLVPSSLDKVLRFSFIEPRVKDVGRVVVNPAFREVLNQFNAAAGGDMLVPWLQRTARQTVSTPSTGKYGFVKDWIFQRVRRNTGLQMMVANVSNTLQQFTGLALSTTKVKPTYLKSALWRYVQHPMVIAEEVAAKSEFMASNHNLSAFDMQQQAEDILLNPNVYEKVKDFSVKNGYLLQQITQRTVNVVTWAGAYDQAIAEGANEKDAVRRADSAVRMTQGTFNAEDISNIETGTPAERAFTQFYTYFNMQSNLLGSVAVGAIREKGLVGAAPTMLKLYAVFAIASIASEVITMAAKGGPDPDDDELTVALNLLIMPQIRTALAMLPFVGQLVNLAINQTDNKRYNDRLSTAPFVSQVETTFRAPTSLYNYAMDDGSMKMAVKDTLAAIGMTTGLPAGALGRPLGYLAGIADGKYEPSGPLDLTRGLITGMKSQ